MECGASRSIAGREGKFTPEQQTIIVRTTGLPLRDGKGSNVVNLPPVAGLWPPHSQKWCPIGKKVLAPTISIGHSAAAAARTASVRVVHAAESIHSHHPWCCGHFVRKVGHWANWWEKLISTYEHHHVHWLLKVSPPVDAIGKQSYGTQISSCSVHFERSDFFPRLSCHSLPICFKFSTNQPNC